MARRTEGANSTPTARRSASVGQPKEKPKEKAKRKTTGHRPRRKEGQADEEVPSESASPSTLAPEEVPSESASPSTLAPQDSHHGGGENSSQEERQAFLRRRDPVVLGKQAVDGVVHIPLDEGDVKPAPLSNEPLQDVWEHLTDLTREVECDVSLRQIRGYWVFVAIDCGLAFATIFPVICIPPFLYLLVKYNFILKINFKREQVQNNDCWSLLAKFQSCFIIVFDFCLLFVGWIWMLVESVRFHLDCAWFWTGWEKLLERDNFKPLLIVSYMQVSFLRNSLFQLALLYVQILRHQVCKADIMVRQHKDSFKKKLVDPDKKASAVLKVMEMIIAKKHGSYSLDRRTSVMIFMLVVSAVLLIVGMADLAERKEQEAREVLFAGKDDDWWQVRSHTATVIMSLGWIRLVSLALHVVRSYHKNVDKVLLFSATTATTPFSPRPEMYSARVRARLKDMELQKLVLEDENSEALPGANKEEPKTREASIRLDLAELKDLRAWWLLRRYTEIDLVNEIVQVESFGVMVACLLAVFFILALLDAILRFNLLTWGFVLVYLASFCLWPLLGQVFEYGIEVNSITALEARALSDANIKLLLSNEQSTTNLASMRLSVLQKKLEGEPPAQRFFGIAVTERLRTGLLASGVVSVFAWGRGVLQEFVTKVDEEFVAELFGRLMENRTFFDMSFFGTL